MKILTENQLKKFYRTGTTWQETVDLINAFFCKSDNTLRPLTMDEWTERRSWMVRPPSWKDGEELPISAIDYSENSVRVGYVWLKSVRMLELGWQMRSDENSTWQPCGIAVPQPSRDLTGEELQELFCDARGVASNWHADNSIDQDAWNSVASKLQRKAGV